LIFLFLTGKLPLILLPIKLLRNQIDELNIPGLGKPLLPTNLTILGLPANPLGM
jgi:hypothetical protein